MARLQRADLQRLIRDRIDLHAAVGLACATVDGNLKTTKAVSGSKGPSREPIESNTPFEIGSLTKLFTAAVLACLVQADVVGLEDPVRDYLPAEVRPLRRGRDVTLRDLATHTSGLPRFALNLADADLASLASYTVNDLYEFVSQYELPREPGTDYEYSNVGYDLLGLALSLRTERRLADLVRDLVLEPLTMTATYFLEPTTPPANIATPHNDRLEPVAPCPIGELAGAGGVVSTLDDMVRFAAANARHDASAIAHALATCRTTQFRISSNRSVGLGWHRRPLVDHPVWWHSGETAGSRAFIAVDERVGEAAIVLSNCMLPIEDLGLHALDERYELAPPDTAEVQLPDDLLERYVGVYTIDDARIVTVTRNDHGLTAIATGLGAAALHARSEREFYVQVIPVGVTFEIDSNGEVSSLALSHDGLIEKATRANEQK